MRRMSERRLRTWILPLVLALLALPAGRAGAAEASPEAAPVRLFAVHLDSQGETKWTPIAIDAELFKRVALADPCGGGSCQTSGGTILSCPATGGPTCASSQVCGCQCGRGPLGTWQSANICGSIE